MKSPIQEQTLRDVLRDMDISDMAQATIRQAGSIGAQLEKQTGVEFVHLEMGVPGLPPEHVGVEAERQALADGVASQYPNMFGIPQLKQAASRFIKAFLDIDIPAQGCVPTVGSMQGSFTLFQLFSQADPRKGKIGRASCRERV